VPTETETQQAALEFYNTMDEAALLTLLGRQDKVIAENPGKADDPFLNPEYDSTHMGLLGDLRAAGRRVMSRWNRELYRLICASDGEEDREKLLSALNLGEGATIAAVTSMLVALNAPAAIAAAAAAVIVKVFIWPARDELCAVWEERIDMDG
jgi:hypothetical protein